MPGLRVVEAHAVEQHQRLAEARAADGEIALHAVGRAFFPGERRGQLEEIPQRVEHQRLAARRKHPDGAVDLFERHGFEGPGDDHGVALLRHLLGEGEYRCKREEKEESEVQIVLYIGLPAMMVSPMNWNDAAEDLLNQVLRSEEHTF